MILRQLLYCENNLELYKGWLLLCVSSRTQTGFPHKTNVLHFTQQLHLHTRSFMYNYFLYQVIYTYKLIKSNHMRNNLMLTLSILMKKDTPFL